VLSKFRIGQMVTKKNKDGKYHPGLVKDVTRYRRFYYYLVEWGEAGSLKNWVEKMVREKFLESNADYLVRTKELEERSSE